MKILVDRAWKKDAYTIGKVYIDGAFFSNSMEDKDRGLKSDMPISQIESRKIYGETAIPTGTYEVRMTYSRKFASRAWAKPYAGAVPEICAVPGFSGVRIHPLNKAEDSLGCIGFGKNDTKGWISQSTAYYRTLLDKYILPAIKRGENIIITIR